MRGGKWLSARENMNLKQRSTAEFNCGFLVLVSLDLRWGDLTDIHSGLVGIFVDLPAATPEFRGGGRKFWRFQPAVNHNSGALRYGLFRTQKKHEKSKKPAVW